MGISNFFYEEDSKELLLTAIKNYPDLKKFYPIQFIDLRFQVDLIHHKETQLFEEYRGATSSARLFVIF